MISISSHRLLLFVAFGLLVSSAEAAPSYSEMLFEASDADENDTLGQAVAISGNIALVGADVNDDGGNNAGSAFLYDVTTGEELHKLTASVPEASALFGHSVEIDGNRAIIGAFPEDSDGEDSGAAYIFDVTTGQELHRLISSDIAENDFFGHGVDISGNIAIVGAHGDDDNGPASGSAYLYDITTGEELFKLTASDGGPGHQFGYWAAIDGDIAIVGAKFDDHAGFRTGSAYLYNVNTGQELMKLTASDAAAGDFFGYAVAVEGDRAIVGAYRDDEAGFEAGAVYVFDVNSGEELYKITASDGDSGDFFGYALGVSGNTLVVGAYGAPNDEGAPRTGAAYIYDLTFGDELGKITASDGEAHDEFGTAIEISGANLLVGALGVDTDEFDNIGGSYSYEISSLFPPGADFDGDGTVDNDDLLLWQSSVPVLALNPDKNNEVNGLDFLAWQRGYQSQDLFDDSHANLDQLGAVDTNDIAIWAQTYGESDTADLDNDGDSDGLDFLELQRELTPYDKVDVNRDRRVDGQDLEFWNSTYGWDADRNNDGRPDGDANGDGLVTQLDYLWWLEQSGNAPPLVAASQVPEPSALLLLAQFIVACSLGHRRRR